MLWLPEEFQDSEPDVGSCEREERDRLNLLFLTAINWGEICPLDGVMILTVPGLDEIPNGGETCPGVVTADDVVVPRYTGQGRCMSWDGDGDDGGVIIALEDVGTARGAVTMAPGIMYENCGRADDIAGQGGIRNEWTGDLSAWCGWAAFCRLVLARLFWNHVCK